MRTYTDKASLKEAIKTTYEKYITEFIDIPNELRDSRNSEVDRTPAENLAYQVGWTTLVLKWENEYRAGHDVKTPSEKFKWN